MTSPSTSVVREFRELGTVIELQTVNENADHPAQFPPALAFQYIRAFGAQICYDAFVGAGSTIIACEQLGKKCRAMEIDPGYVAVSIQRWADATGKTPKLLNGK